MEHTMSTKFKGLLNSYSQVLLIENKISGLLILFAIFIGDFSGGFLSLLGTILANEWALLLKKDEDKIRSGLYGYCAVLIAIAGSLFLNNIGALLLSVVGSLFSVPCMDFVEKVLHKRKLPALTMPFVTIVSITILIGYMSPVLYQGQGGQLAAMSSGNTDLHLLNALLKGFGQIFLLDNLMSSLFIVGAIILARPKVITSLIFSIVLVFALVILLGIDQSMLSEGLLTYNTILTVLAVQEFLQGSAWKLWKTITVSTLVTFIIHCSLYPLLTTFGISMLTWPFVIGTWVILFYLDSDSETYDFEHE